MAEEKIDDSILDELLSQPAKDEPKEPAKSESEPEGPFVPHQDELGRRIVNDLGDYETRI